MVWYTSRSTDRFAVSLTLGRWKVGRLPSHRMSGPDRMRRTERLSATGAASCFCADGSEKPHSDRERERKAGV